MRTVADADKIVFRVGLTLCEIVCDILDRIKSAVLSFKAEPAGRRQRHRPMKADSLPPDSSQDVLQNLLLVLWDNLGYAHHRKDDLLVVNCCHIYY